MKKVPININTILAIFLKTVTFLVNTNINGRSLYAYSSDEKFLNFKAVSFKTALKKYIDIPEGERPDKFIKLYMHAFKILGLIVTIDNRFTNVSWISGKTVRSITIKKEIFNYLKDVIQ